MTEKIQAAVLGAGLMAHTHARILQEVGIPVAVVWDRHLEKAQALARLCGARPVSDLTQVMDSGARVVHITLPPGLHYETARTFLEAGFHVLCEKPLTLTGTEGNQLAALAREEGLSAGVDLNLRYYGGVQKVRLALKEPAFGSLRLVHGHYLQDFHALPAPRDWRYEEKAAGKMRAVTEIGTHFFDLVQYLTGRPIEAVSAVFACFSPERRLDGRWMYPLESPRGEKIQVDSEDAALVSFRLKGGILGNVVLSEACPGHGNDLALCLTGEGESLEWRSEEGNSLRLGRKAQGIQKLTQPFSGGFPDTIQALFRAFYASVEQKEEGPSGRTTEEELSYPTFQEGADLAFLSEVLAESAKRGGLWLPVGGQS